MYAYSRAYLDLKARSDIIIASHKDWLEAEFQAIQRKMSLNPTWLATHTKPQETMLAICMDMDKTDRIELLSALIGYQVDSSRDLRITKWVMSVLIEYFKEDVHAQDLKGYLGFQPASVVSKARVAARKAAVAEKHRKKDEQRKHAFNLKHHLLDGEQLPLF